MRSAFAELCVGDGLPPLPVFETGSEIRGWLTTGHPVLLYFLLGFMAQITRANELSHLIYRGGIVKSPLPLKLSAFHNVRRRIITQSLYQ